MAQIFVASCRSWCHFTQFLKFPARKMSYASFAVFSRHSRLDAFGCLPMLQCRLSSYSEKSHFSWRSASKRWQTFTEIEISVRCLRKASSKIVHTGDKAEKESDTTVVTSSDSSSELSDSSTDDNDAVTSDSDSAKVSRNEGDSTHQAQPVSDVDVDKEMLRYDYEEFELIPDEEVSAAQPVQKPLPVELTSKWRMLNCLFQILIFFTYECYYMIFFNL